MVLVLLDQLISKAGAGGLLLGPVEFMLWGLAEFHLLILFNVYVKLSGKVIQGFGVTPHQYAIQLCFSLMTKLDGSLEYIKRCLEKIMGWSSVQTTGVQFGEAAWRLWSHSP